MQNPPYIDRIRAATALYYAAVKYMAATVCLVKAEFAFQSYVNKTY